MADDSEKTKKCSADSKVVIRKQIVSNSSQPSTNDPPSFTSRAGGHISSGEDNGPTDTAKSPQALPQDEPENQDQKGP